MQIDVFNALELNVYKLREVTTLSDFFSLEGNSYTKELLLKTIDAAISKKMEKEELIFNVYSIEIFPQENKVIIYNDIDPDENPGVEFPLMEFYTAVKNFNSL